MAKHKLSQDCGFVCKSKVKLQKFTKNMAEFDRSYAMESSTQGLVKGAKFCLNPYFFGWLEK